MKTILSWSTALVVAFALETRVGGQHHFDSWTTENGLPQNSVNDIVQTRDGYLWLATHGGLVRFDGVRFTIFDASVGGIGSQRIKALHEDRNGVLWAASEDGMLIRYENGRFTTFTSKDGLPFANGARIDEDNAGNLWIFWVGVVTRFDGHRAVNFQPGELPKRVSPTPDNYLDGWWSHDADGVHVLSRGRVSTYVVPREWVMSGVAGVSQDRSGTLVIRTRNASVIHVATDGIERLTRSDGRPAGAEPNFHFATDREGGIWFHDRRARLYRLAAGESKWVDVPGPRSVYQDREGSIWIGTLANGVYRIDDRTITLHANQGDISLKNAYPILQDRTGAIWIGHGSLDRFENGRWTSYGAADGVSGTNRVTSLHEDTRGRLWVGTEQRLTYFDNGRLKPYPDPGRFLADVSAMNEEPGGAFWFATGSGLVKAAQGRLTRYTTKDGLSHDRVTTLFRTKTGVLWIGTFRGLTRLAGGVFTAYTEKDGFIGNQVRAIHEDGEGVLWVGTYDGGLYRMKNDRLTRFTRKQGLHDNGVFQLLEDEHGHLWMGSNRGISRINRAELNDVAEGTRRVVNLLVLGAKDGLTPVEVNGGRQPSGLKAADGTLWFPALGGVAVINPADYQAAGTPPRPLIEEFSMAGERKALSPEMVIPADTPYLEIRYTAPTFMRPEQVRFRHKLIGLDDNWIEAGDRRIATLQRIPPGRYQFVVLASSPDGVWSDSPASLTLVVLPPFWRTWWFVTVMSVLVASIVGIGYQRRIGGLRRLHRLQEAFSQRLIDLQERERGRLSSEMHDSLGQHLAIIKKRVRTTREMVPDDTGIGVELDEIAIVADQIDAEMKDIAQGLRPYHLDKIGLTGSIEAMIRQVGSACAITFTADIDPIDSLFPETSRIHVYRIVQECLNNVMKHSHASHATITVKVQSKRVEIAVDDNGTGVNRDVREAGGRRTGFGLMGLRERVRMLGGAVAIRSGAGTGTTVVITLPIDRASHG